MKLRSLMNNPEGEKYNENQKNHLDGKPVQYGDIVEVSKEFAKLPQLQTLINCGYCEEVVEKKK